MSLPGKLCIGILEEDNPLKAYFRFKPILVDQDGAYVPYAQGEMYPEEGCVRIVPDKNESFHFKSRMRRMGLFCVVDLRAHPDDNDKIRPNKNYRGDGAEQNAYIIYSDVVREPARDMIFDILPACREGVVLPRPNTASVLVAEGEGLGGEKWTWNEISGAEDQVSMHATGETCPVEKLQRFELPGFKGETVRFAILPSGCLPQVIGEPAETVTSEEKTVTSNEETVTQSKKPVTDAPENPPQAPKTAPSGAETVTCDPPAAPATSKSGPAESHAAKAAAALSAPAEERGKGNRTAEKPWIHRDASMLPRPVDPRLSPTQRIMAAQAGLNPRQGRSLKELIDEKWTQSRLNQLGHPVQPLATGEPVISPVEAAVEAVKGAWSQPDLRGTLLEALSGIDEFGASLQECREAVRKSDIEAALNDLEAQRLSLLNEQDKLAAGNAALRQKLKQEICRDAEGDVAEALRRTEAAKARTADFERKAEEARQAARDAQGALDKLTGEALEKRVLELAMNRRILERLDALRGEAAPAAAPLAAQDIAPEALLERIKKRFAAAGVALGDLDAANLTACVLCGKVLTFSGPAGCGKTLWARLLADALGWADAGRLVRFAPGRGSLEADGAIAALGDDAQAPAMILLDDANLAPAPDMLRGLGAQREEPERRLCLTVRDDGCPLPAQVLDAGFMLRLSCPADAPWQPAKAQAAAPVQPVRLAALADRLTGGPVPAAIQQAMDRLRKALSGHGAALSRRALDDSWRYCAAMTALLGKDADPMAVFDRAVAQRLLPALLAVAPTPALAALPGLLRDLPVSRALLEQPVPVRL